MDFSIEEAARMIENRDLPSSNFFISLDSQPAIQPLGFHLVKAKRVRSCMDFSTPSTRQHDIYLYLVPGHCSIEGNKTADDLARKILEMSDEEINAPLGEYFSILKKAIWNSINSERTDILDCRIKT